MTIEKDLLRIQKDKPNPYEDFHLLSNPFPGAKEINLEVLSNQENVKEAFIDNLLKFGNGADNITILGLNGAGKTSILKYFDFYVDEVRKRQYLDAIVQPVYVIAGEEDYSYLHAEIVKVVLQRTLFDVVKSYIPVSEPQTEDFNVGDNEVLNSIQRITSSQNLFSTWSIERAEAFINWLKGNKLNPAEKKHLGNLKDIPNSSISIKYLNDYLEIANRLNVVNGLVIFIDEFEHLFTYLSKAKQSRYMSDIRHLLDVLGNKVIVVFAMTPGNKDIEKYPAVNRRMGNQFQLEPISSADKAIEYVSDYMKYGKAKFIEEKNADMNIDEIELLSPLNEQIIADIFSELSDEGNDIVVPGMFLPRMKEEMKNIVEGATE